MAYKVPASLPRNTHTQAGDRDVAMQTLLALQEISKQLEVLRAIAKQVGVVPRWLKEQDT